MNKPVLVDAILFSLFLKQFRLGASTVSRSKVFHLSMTRFEKKIFPNVRVKAWFTNVNSPWNTLPPAVRISTVIQRLDELSSLLLFYRITFTTYFIIHQQYFVLSIVMHSQLFCITWELALQHFLSLTLVLDYCKDTRSKLIIIILINYLVHGPLRLFNVQGHSKILHLYITP